MEVPLARLLLTLVFSLMVAAISPALSAPVSLKEAMGEKSLGSADAPVVMIEYSSLGCPHCAEFHRETLPRIKAEYIDTGKVRLVFRDFPFGAPATAAAMLARCAGDEKYFGFLDILFRSQASWSHSRDPLGALKQTARFAGLSETDVDVCLNQSALLDDIQSRKEAALKTKKVDSTPTFFVGETMISGSQPFEVFKAAIDKALSGAKGK